MNGIWGVVTKTAVLTALAAGSAPAIAHDGDPRWRPIKGLAFAAQPSTEGTPSTGAMLSMRDRYALPSVQAKAVTLATGPFALSLYASRFRCARQMGIGGVRTGDRLLADTAGVDVGFDVAPRLTLRTYSTVMRMRRRFAIQPDRTRAMTSTVMSMGVGTERAGLGALVLDYTDVESHGHRNAADHIAELVGGAPPVGRGLRLSLSNMIPSDPSGRVSWSVSTTALRRASMDDIFAHGGRGLMDRRAEVAIGIAL